eukprot:5225278-Lingulodinium_polyedra.AAC.1
MPSPRPAAGPFALPPATTGHPPASRFAMAAAALTQAAGFWAKSVARGGALTRRSNAAWRRPCGAAWRPSA